MKKEHSSRWRKLDNAAQAFPAATGKKGYESLPILLPAERGHPGGSAAESAGADNGALPGVFHGTAERSFWFYLEQRDLPAKVEEEKTSAVQ